MLLGLLLSAGLVALGVGAGWQQLRLYRRLREQPFVPEEDRRHFYAQGRRRLIVSTLLTIIGALIAIYYLSGMDARLVAIPERHRQAATQGESDPTQPPAHTLTDDDRRFTRWVGYYWILIILLLGVVVMLACLDVIATRRYWMARYRELQADHQARLQRDLIVFRQRRRRFRTIPRSPNSDEPPLSD